MAVGKIDDKTGKNQITVEGYGIKLCMNKDGVVGTEANWTSQNE